MVNKYKKWHENIKKWTIFHLSHYLFLAMCHVSMCNILDVGKLTYLQPLSNRASKQSCGSSSSHVRWTWCTHCSSSWSCRIAEKVRWLVLCLSQQHPYTEADPTSMGAPPSLHWFPSYCPAQLASQQQILSTVGLQSLGTHRAGRFVFSVIPDIFPPATRAPLTQWIAWLKQWVELSTTIYLV